MGLTTFRWAVITDDDTETVCAETVYDVLEETGYDQPNAIVRLGFAEWDEDEQRYK